MNALYFVLLLLLSTISIFDVKKLYIFLLLVVSGLCVYFFNILWLNPWRLRQKLRQQGIKGPPPSFLYGNLPEMQKIQASVKKMIQKNNQFEIVGHDYTSTLFPYFEKWRKQYGPIFTYSTGNKQHLYVNDPELVKKMNQSASLELGKPSYVTKRLAPMLGNGILRSNGQVWSQQRKIVAPEFFVEKVKGMVGLMRESAESLTSKWEACIENQGSDMAEIKVDEDLRSLTGNVIAKACFGSSYLKGKEIFSKLRTLQEALSKQSFLFGLGTSGLFPTKEQKQIGSLEKEIETLIWETVQERETECLSKPTSSKDLMQMLLEEAINFVGKESSKKFIVDNCKNIYFAGHESTATAASWCLMLLALHPEWQDRIRREIAEVCADGNLDSDSLPKLKTVTMVIHEVMRLYAPGAFVSREALEETQIGHILVPKGVCVWTLIPTLHRDPEIWGSHVNKFNPERFADGVSNSCKNPHVYIPFGLGPRLCLGKNFALVQLKIVISLIISKFAFSLSPKYKHSPAYRMIVEPGHGVHLLVKKYCK